MNMNISRSRSSRSPRAPVLVPDRQHLCRRRPGCALSDYFHSPALISRELQGMARRHGSLPASERESAGGLTGSRFEAATISPAPVVPICFLRGRARGCRVLAMRAAWRTPRPSSVAQRSRLAVDDRARNGTPLHRPSHSDSRRAGDRAAPARPAAAGRATTSTAIAGCSRGVESIEDPHRRYWAASSLIEQGLAASAMPHAARLPALLVTLAGGVLELLEREPSEPRLLDHAGVIFGELWSMDAAEAMFEAAKRLDPQLDGLERNLQELAVRRLQRSSAVDARRCALRCRELARRALEIAARAQPAEGMRLSLCMIVRDEQEMLPRCLTAVAAAVDEIVIVDTGSTDATIEIARSFGARVIEHEWTGSFAEARNVSFDAASGDWLMYLDADEVLVARGRRAAALAHRAHLARGVLPVGDQLHGRARRRHGRRPQRAARISQPARVPLRGAPARADRAPASRLSAGAHRGDSGTRRALRLPRRRARHAPEVPPQHRAAAPAAGRKPADARSCTTTSAASTRPPVEHAEALAELERAWKLLEAQADRDSYKFAPALVSRLVKALRLCDRPQDALARAEQGLELFPGFTDLVLEQARRRDRARATASARSSCANAASRWARRHAATRRPSVPARTCRGCIWLSSDATQGELERAIEQLEHCLREHPQFIGSVLPYASALLADGMAPDAVVGELERHMPDPAPPARFMLGTALYEGGAAQRRRGAVQARASAPAAFRPCAGGARRDAAGAAALRGGGQRGGGARQ